MTFVPARYVHPQLGEECARHLQKFYLELRGSRRDDCVPVTTRQLEAMVRLVQARARLELREHCTAQDALDVIEVPVCFVFQPEISVENAQIMYSKQVFSQMSASAPVETFVISRGLSYSDSKWHAPYACLPKTHNFTFRFIQIHLL